MSELLKEIERIESLAENKRDCVKLANFWKMYALELRDEKNAELKDVRTKLQNWKDFNVKCQKSSLKHSDQCEQLTAEIESLRTRIEELTKGEPVGYVSQYGLDNVSEYDGIAFKAKGDGFYKIPLFLSAPEGYVLVPIEPTEKMIRAAFGFCDFSAETYKIIYKAMIEASNA